MRLFLLGVLLSLGGCEACGYSSVDNTMTGQVKKVHHNTPIICPDYYSADVSLGVMRNGAGSVSTHDVVMTIADNDNLKVFESAASTGKIVEVTYKERRATTCINDYVVTAAKILDDVDGGIAK